MISCRQAVDEARSTHPERAALSQEVVPPSWPDLFGGARRGRALLLGLMRYQALPCCWGPCDELVCLRVTCSSCALPWAGSARPPRLVQGFAQ